MTLEMDGRFRVWAFHVFYVHTFRHVLDPFRRFGKALEASSREILRPELVEEWARQYGGKPLAALLEEDEAALGLQMTLFTAPWRRRSA